MPKKCVICKQPALADFNINFKLTPICEDCADAIFLQQAEWYVAQRRAAAEKKDKKAPLTKARL